MLDYSFKLDFQVRDYECDMQGIVNNSVYLNYLEHTRHEFLKTIGIDFAEVTRQKINLVVIRCELDYKHPLRSGDSFWVGLNLQQVSRIRFAFLQDIYRYPDNRLILNSRFIGTGMNEKGRPKLPPEIEKALVQNRNPCPQGKVRVHRLCHMDDHLLHPDLSCPYNIRKGVTNESIS